MPEMGLCSVGACEVEDGRAQVSAAKTNAQADNLRNSAKTTLPKINTTGRLDSLQGALKVRELIEMDRAKAEFNSTRTRIAAVVTWPPGPLSGMRRAAAGSAANQV